MRILLTGGGTAGHVLPNIAVIDELKKRDQNLKLLYLGSCRGPEKEIIENAKVSFKAIFTGKFRRYFDFRNFLDLPKIFLGILQSFLIILKFKPQVIFSKGGYVSVPVVLGGWFLRRRIIIHEADASPSLATKITACLADQICVAYPEIADLFPQKKVIVTGNPLRSEIFQGDQKIGLNLTGFTKALPIVLVMGGSLGSLKINQVLRESLPELLKFCQIIHLCGKGKLDRTKKRPRRYCEREYANIELKHFYAIADLIISRAGAFSITEIQALKKPSILIPLPRSASRGDQLANARVLEKRGACIVISEEKLTSLKLTKVVLDLLHHPAQLKKLSRKSYYPFNPKAASRIAQVLMQMAASKIAAPK